MTNAPPKLSVIVNNYNYEDYVGFAIESVLAQDPCPEVIVVDDCSTDNSRAVISAFGDRIRAVLLDENQGQGGAFNFAYPHATGDLILFLDADDFMLPGSAKTILENYDRASAIYHYRMRYADEDSNTSGIYPAPENPLAPGNISEQLRKVGTYDGTVTSGMVFSKHALDQVMPMENPNGYRYGGDGYLTASVPLYGPSQSIDVAITAYRLHGRQHSQFASALAKRARWRIEHAHERYATTTAHAQRLGLQVADDLGRTDAFVTREHLVSLLLEPQHHPYADDTVSGLIQRYRESAAKPASGLKRMLGSVWWFTFKNAPRAAQRAMIKWLVDANTRPVWLQTFGRWIRRRLRGA